MTTLYMYRGDDREFTFTVSDTSEESGLLDLTGADVRFTARKGDAVVIEKEVGTGITLAVPETGGQFTLAIDAADTQDLMAPERLAYDVEVTRAAKTLTVVVDALEVLPDVSWPVVP